MRPEVYRAEAARLLDEARKMESGLKCLEGLVIGVMQHMGGKPIKGKAATLCLQNNPPSVDVRQPEMVPDEYKRARIAMPFSLYKMLMGALGTLEGKFAQALYRQLLDCRVEPEIMRSLALPVLKQQGPCPECNGSGQRLDRVAEDFAPDCPTCKGTGKVYIGAVAGLALVTDQVHLRIK